MSERVRPESVPVEAWWSPKDNAWVLGPRDAQGRLHGRGLPHLKELRIRGHRLPAGVEAQVRAALPRCVIY